MLVYTVIFVLLLAGFTGFTHAEMPAGNSDPNPVNENNPLLPVAMFRSNGNPAPLEKGGVDKSPPLEKGGKGGFERAFSDEKMVLVKGGCFDMGDSFGDGDIDERPAHSVCVDDFYIGKYEVTQKEWSKVMGNNPSSFRSCEDCPVENISYLNIKEFMGKLNRMTGGKYRLPTEAEWEYAARSGGKKEKWAGMGNEEGLGECAWYMTNAGGRPYPVGQKMPNGLGLYDMTGNIQEWVADWYADDYYKTSSKNNPSGPPSSQYRVARGGSFLNKSWGSRTVIRYRFTQDDRGREFGFRLAAPVK